MLRLDNLRKTYRGPSGDVRALDGLTLEVGAGEFVAVRGPSGCGKTTLLLIAGGLLRPDGGLVLLDGQDVYALGDEERACFRAAALGFVFQQFHLLPYLSALDNVLTANLPLKRPGARDRALSLLDGLGLAARAAHVPAQLSTGERQRVALARALLNGPKVLLADEPTGNLDPDSSRVVLDRLAEFAAGGGAVLLVTHDADAAARAGRVVYLRPGHPEPIAAGVLS